MPYVRTKDAAIAEQVAALDWLHELSANPLLDHEASHAIDAAMRSVREVLAFLRGEVTAQ